MLIRTSRRSFVTGLSLAGASLVMPFLQRAARADLGLKAPLRLLVIQSPDGRPYSMWKPSGTETSFTFGSTMAPFEPLKSDLVVVDGSCRESCVRDFRRKENPTCRSPRAYMKA
jgi:hypothetical protein